MLTTLLEYAKGSPLLLASLVGAGGVLAIVERIAGLSGPITKVVHWWQGRELAKLRREALLRAERRRLAAEEEAGRISDLSAQLSELRTEVEWLRNERDSARRREVRMERYAHELGQYVWRLLHIARSAGVTYADPPLAPVSGATNPSAGRNPAPAVPAPR